MAAVEEVQKHSVHTLVFRSLKRAHDMFVSDRNNLAPLDDKSQEIFMKTKSLEYGHIVDTVKKQKREAERKRYNLALPAIEPSIMQPSTSASSSHLMLTQGENVEPSSATPLAGAGARPGSDSALALPLTAAYDGTTRSLLPSKKIMAPKPKWHPPWKLYRVISGHTGWVRAIDVEPANEWFVTGAGDRMVKIWDLASGKLKLSLTGHVSTVRAVKVSPRHPYLFSAGEDKQLKCWDLEYNKVIRHYHGHLSAIHDLAIHPTIDILLSCGRDSTVRVWDMRTKANIHTLTGHTNTVASVATQAAEPQIISGSHDSTVRLWDLTEGRSSVTLTNHKKSVRSVVIHPSLYMFASASPDNIKQWKGGKGEFVKNLSGHSSILNAMAVNKEDVLVSGADNGTMYFWDWISGFNFQKVTSKPQSGSIDSENGIFSLCFDHSGSRLLSGEADKTIKCYKEDENATEETHPLNWKPEILRRKMY